MNLAEKVSRLRNICGIAIDLSAVPIASYSENSQSFFDSYLVESSAEAVYFGKKNVSFSEASKSSRAGNFWESEVQIQFPGTDKNRAKRIEKFRQARYLVVNVTGGLSFFLGRNDYYQNARPKVEIKTNEHLIQVKYTFTQIYPTGFLPEYNGAVLPHSVPVNLLNAN